MDDPNLTPNYAPAGAQSFAPGSDVGAQIRDTQSAKPGSTGLSPNGRVHYLVAHEDGRQGEIDEHTLLRQLQTVGYHPLSASADGMSVSVAGPDGQPQELATHDVLGKMGWQVQAAKPANPNYDHVNMGYRALIESPLLKDDDDAKRAILTHKLAKAGVQDPKVLGNGSDWYGFDPDSAQWFALTNKPGMDMSDLSQAAEQAPRMIGSAIGGAGGALAGEGIASIPGAALGSAGGGFTGDRLADAATMFADPDYLNFVDHKNVLKGMGTQLATDAVGGGAAGALGHLPGVGKLLERGIAGPMAKTLGAGAEALGGGVAKTAGWLAEHPTVMEAGALGGIPGIPSIPVAGELDGLGWLMRTPRGAVRAGAKGLGHIGNMIAGEEEAQAGARQAFGQKLKDISTGLLKPSQATMDEAIPSGTQRMADAITGRASNPLPQAPINPGARDILGNAGEMMGQRVGQRVGHGNYMNAVDDPASAVSQWLHNSRLEGAADATLEGHTGDAWQHHVTQRETSTAEQLQREMRQRGAEEVGGKGRRIGETIGSGFDALGRGGEVLNRAGVGIAKGVVKGAGAIGRGAQIGGKVLQGAGTLSGPLEIPAAANMGADQLHELLKRHYRRGALQGAQAPRTLDKDYQLATR